MTDDRMKYLYHYFAYRYYHWRFKRAMAQFRRWSRLAGNEAWRLSDEAIMEGIRQLGDDIMRRAA